MSELKFPDELKYSKEHQWVKVEDDTATIGITDFAQHQLNDVVFVDLPEIGKAFSQGKNLSSIESVKSVSDVFCPISGEVIGVNKELEENPEVINEDCYGKGWIAKLKIKDKTELDNLLSAEEYEKEVS